MSALLKLQAARIRLQNTKMKKSGHNKFAGYSYFELGDFLPEIQVIFADLGLCGVVSYTAEIATLTITDTEDNSSVTITSPMGSAALKGCHEVQNIGAVETYQRRYLWMTAMEIVEHDALDASTGSDKPKSSKPVAQDTKDNLSEEAREYIESEAKKVIALRDDKEAMFDEYMAIKSKLDADEEVALWSCFDSTMRSSIKSVGQSRSK